jgi:hypothetical protein
LSSSHPYENFRRGAPAGPKSALFSYHHAHGLSTENQGPSRALESGIQPLSWRNVLTFESGLDILGCRGQTDAGFTWHSFLIYPDSSNRVSTIVPRQAWDIVDDPSV